MVTFIYQYQSESSAIFDDGLSQVYIQTGFPTQTELSIFVVISP